MVPIIIILMIIITWPSPRRGNRQRLHPYSCLELEETETHINLFSVEIFRPIMVTDRPFNHQAKWGMPKDSPIKEHLQRAIYETFFIVMRRQDLTNKKTMTTTMTKSICSGGVRSVFQLTVSWKIWLGHPCFLCVSCHRSPVSPVFSSASSSFWIQSQSLFLLSGVFEWEF